MKPINTIKPGDIVECLPYTTENHGTYGERRPYARFRVDRICTEKQDWLFPDNSVIVWGVGDSHRWIASHCRKVNQ